MAVSIARNVGSITLAFVAAAASVMLFAGTNGSQGIPVAGWGWMALITAAPLLLLFRPLGVQVLARAILWSNAILGTLLCLVVRSAETVVIPAFVLLLASGLSLIVAGSRPLAEAQTESTFAPKAFRGTLLAIMVMALSDTCTLLFWGGVATEFEGSFSGGLLLGAGVVMAVAVLGLARLKAWGFALNLLANLTIAIGIWFVPSVPDPVRWCLVATAVGQMGVGAPILRALIRGREPEAPMKTSILSLMTALIVSALVLASVIAMMIGPEGHL